MKWMVLPCIKVCGAMITPTLRFSHPDRLNSHRFLLLALLCIESDDIDIDIDIDKSPAGTPSPASSSLERSPWSMPRLQTP